jgi:hypothetical protein
LPLLALAVASIKRQTRRERESLDRLLAICCVQRAPDRNGVGFVQHEAGLVAAARDDGYDDTFNAASCRWRPEPLFQRVDEMGSPRAAFGRTVLVVECSRRCGNEQRPDKGK